MKIDIGCVYLTMPRGEWHKRNYLGSSLQVWRERDNNHKVMFVVIYQNLGLGSLQPPSLIWPPTHGTLVSFSPISSGQKDMSNIFE